MAAPAMVRPMLTGIWTPVATRPKVRPRARFWSGTPEIYFDKAIDNSRLVKVADRRRNREMAMLSAAIGIFFALVMVYAWQHFSAVEYGYQIEALKTQRETLNEANRALRLEQAELSDPERIDGLARKMGLETPQPGQVQPLEPATPDSSAPVMARVTEPIVGP